MPRTQTTIRVVPSKLAWGCQFLLALAVSGVVLSHAPGWLELLALAWLVPLGWWLWHDQERGELHGEPEPGGGWRWSWQPASATEAQPVELRCAYLGPWLVAIDIEGSRIWLWPDSAPRDMLRELRCVLLR
ncbi:hypothetical protein ACOJCM_16555 [Billgrantia sp. LNSP4103-1]|uniref:hypothetical protein n=1 Tax=Billgrantia sp. LNSP4103-1 TaxID=3410266 RepID=UPI00403F3770